MRSSGIAIRSVRLLVGIGSMASLALTPAPTRAGLIVYSNDFNVPPGSSFPGWTSSVISYSNAITPPGSGTLPAPAVTNVTSPKGAQTFLGVFGGPPIGLPSDPGYRRTRVEQTISLALKGLAPHTSATVSFDLYILKSWDGSSPAYGPDRLTLGVSGGPTLLDTTFSNNPKIGTDKSFQDYPVLNSLPQAGASSTNTLGYSNFFTDSIYRFSFTFDHSAKTLTLNFGSSLFEGKGTADECWGLDNVSVVTETGSASRSTTPPRR